MEVVNEGGGRWSWSISIFEHFDGPSYVLGSLEIGEASFPPEQTEAGLRGLFRTVEVVESSGRLYYACET